MRAATAYGEEQAGPGYDAQTHRVPIMNIQAHRFHARRAFAAALVLAAALVAGTPVADAQEHGGGHASGGGHGGGPPPAGAHGGAPPPAGAGGGGYPSGYGHPVGGGYRPGYAYGGGYTVHHGGGHYWYQGGYWYRPWGGRWVVCAPPYGAFVPWLPWGYTSLWIGGYPYYYYNNAYYVYRDANQGYEVVPPPEGAPNAPDAAAPQSDNLFAYPRSGQSPEQQATDRYECHKWANEQTGYDPTQASGGVAAADAGAKRADYFRAISSCLEGRGYSVR